MSYDVHLKYPDERECLVDNHEDGGTYVIGGTDEAWLNITYNYGRYFYRNIDSDKGLRWLYGKNGAECAPRLREAIEKLTREIELWAILPPVIANRNHEWCRSQILDPVDPAAEFIWIDDRELVDPPNASYWAPTPHNARRPLQTLLSWAVEHPEAIFGGD